MVLGIQSVNTGRHKLVHTIQALRVAQVLPDWKDMTLFYFPDVHSLVDILFDLVSRSFRSKLVYLKSLYEIILGLNMFIFRIIMPMLQHKHKNSDFRDFARNNLCLSGMNMQIYFKRIFSHDFVPVNTPTLFLLECY